jgi:hypothetical protein
MTSSVNYQDAFLRSVRQIHHIIKNPQVSRIDALRPGRRGYLASAARLAFSAGPAEYSRLNGAGRELQISTQLGR